MCKGLGEVKQVMTFLVVIQKIYHGKWFLCYYCNVSRVKSQ